jgi:hypothetical protein
MNLNEIQKYSNRKRLGKAKTRAKQQSGEDAVFKEAFSTGAFHATSE